MEENRPIQGLCQDRAKGSNSRIVSPMFEQQSLLAKNRDRAQNARWNATLRDASDSDIRRLVDETSTIKAGTEKRTTVLVGKGLHRR